MSDLTILGLRLERTSYACPEQYDVFSGDTQVGYLRLRHGNFTVECPDCIGELVYFSSDCKGDGLFEEDERDEYLTRAVEKILGWLNEPKRHKR